MPTCRATTALMVLTGLLMVDPGDAHAEEGWWRHQSALRARSNRVGVGIFSDTGYRVPLYDSEHALLKDAYVESGIVTQISPASFQPGAYFQIVPATPLVLRLSVQHLRFFGLYTSLHEFEGLDPVWDEAELDRREHEGRHDSGLSADAQYQIRLKFGPVVTLFTQQLTYVRADISEGNSWYESTTDLLVAREDAIHALKGTLGYLIFGELQRDFLMVAGHWERYATFETEVRRQIVGGLGLYRPSAEWWGKPVAALVAGTFLEDEYKTGELYIGGFIAVEFGGPKE